jgi:phage terminase large subunit-like protein
MRMQVAAGRPIRATARFFGVGVSTISQRSPDWHDEVDAEALARIAGTVRRAIEIRREITRSLADADSDDRWCELPGPKVDVEEMLFTAARRRRPETGEAETGEAVAPAGYLGDALADAQAPAAPWHTLAHPAQMPPRGPWRAWMMMGGRGAGKTRAGAEWVRERVERGMAKRIALVGPTLHDVRELMIGGPSGLCATGDPAMRPTYEVTRRRLVWPLNGPCAGAVAFAFSAEDPDSLRGPQFDAAWCDEVGAWAYDIDTWQTLAFAMRLGHDPRIVATTTPRPRALVKMLVEKAETGRGAVVLTQASTRANAANLAPEFVSALEEDYGGTEVGRQELDGELIEDMAGAMFSRAVIEASRARSEEAHGFERVVVAVDPPAGASVRSDACGIVVAGVKDGVVFVLADATVRGLRPAEWAARAVTAALAHGAGMIVAESNQGGEMLRGVLVGAAAGRVKVKLQHAKESKRDRAMPVSMMYETGGVRHVRVLKELEDEMCSFGVEQPMTPGRRVRSPDRVDALVWAVRELTAKVVLPRVDAMGAKAE